MTDNARPIFSAPAALAVALLATLAACAAPRGEPAAVGVDGGGTGDAAGDGAELDAPGSGAPARDGAANAGDSRALSDASEASDGPTGDLAADADLAAGADTDPPDLLADAPGDAADSETVAVDLAADAAVDDAADGSSDGAGAADTGGDSAASADGVDADGALDGADLGQDAAADSDDGAPADAVDPPALVTMEIDLGTLPPAPFADITGQYLVPANQPIAPCIAVADFDGDGRQDFLAVLRFGTKATVRTFLLHADGTILKHTELDTTSHTPAFSCSAADFDGDNKPDLLIGGFGGLALYLGDGKGGFADTAGKWLPYFMDYDAVGVVPVDLDGDLDLDVFVPAGFDTPPCNSLTCWFTSSDLLRTLNPPIKQTLQMHDRVLIRGANGIYDDETAKWQVPGGGNQTVAAAVDIDDDGKMDLLVGDDMGSHRLLHNLGGTFATYETAIGFHPYAGAMGWGIGDLNLDGKFDAVLADSGPTAVYQQTAAKPGLPASFTDIGGIMGVWWTTWGASAWTPVVADFDHDGLEDVLLGVSANLNKQQASIFGSLCSATQGGDKPVDPFAGVPSVDILYRRDASGAWTSMQLPPGSKTHVVFINQALIDVDNDGDLDVIQSRPGPATGVMPGAALRILRNDFPKFGGSFRVIVRGKAGNQDALGAVVSATIGGVVHRRLLGGSGGFGGTPSRFAHFGLGKAGEAKAVQVRWPDGKVSALGDAKPYAILQATWP